MAILEIFFRFLITSVKVGHPNHIVLPFFKCFQVISLFQALKWDVKMLILNVILFSILLPYILIGRLSVDVSCFLII